LHAEDDPEVGRPGPEWSRVNPPWSAQEFEKATSDFSDWGQKAWARYHLGLAAGNGVGLITFGGAILKSFEGQANSEVTTALLLPACWLFVLGLICAGLIPAIQAEAYAVLRRSLLEAVRPSGEDGFAWVKTEYKNKVTRLGRWEDTIGKIAAGSFVLGLAYPLIVLSKRYVLTGGFFL
jgi:hypothetical protein